MPIAVRYRHRRHDEWTLDTQHAPSRVQGGPVLQVCAIVIEKAIHDTWIDGEHLCEKHWCPACAARGALVSSHDINIHVAPCMSSCT